MSSSFMFVIFNWVNVIVTALHNALSRLSHNQPPSPPPGTGDLGKQGPPLVVHSLWSSEYYRVARGCAVELLLACIELSQVRVDSNAVLYRKLCSRELR